MLSSLRDGFPPGWEIRVQSDGGDEILLMGYSSADSRMSLSLSKEGFTSSDHFPLRDQHEVIEKARWHIGQY
jgi:hypothetical protein